MTERLKMVYFSRCYMQRNQLSPKILMAIFEALPIDAVIYNWGHDYAKDSSYMIVKSCEFEEVELGLRIPELILEGIQEKGYTRFKVVEPQTLNTYIGVDFSKGLSNVRDTK